jgi:hypothetical protein
MLYDDNTASQTFELYGPKNYSTAEIAAMIDKEIYKERRHINLPKAMLKPVAGLLNRFLWWPVSSADEVEREFHDQVIDDTAKTFKDLGIEPGEISNYIYHYLVRIAGPRLHMRITNVPQARIPKLSILRFATDEREREEREQQILARTGRAVKCWQSMAKGDF